MFAGMEEQRPRKLNGPITGLGYGRHCQAGHRCWTVSDKSGVFVTLHQGRSQYSETLLVGSKDQGHEVRGLVTGSRC